MGMAPNTLERAWQIARNGRVRSLDGVLLALRREGFDPAHASLNHPDSMARLQDALKRAARDRHG